MGNDSTSSSAKFRRSGFDTPIGDDSVVERILDVDVTDQLIPLVDRGDHQIKQDPWRSVGVTFGVGFGLGAIVGLLMSKKSNKH